MNRQEWLSALNGWHRPNGGPGELPLAGLLPGTTKSVGLPATRAILWGSLALRDFPGKWRVVATLQKAFARGEMGERLVERQGLRWQLEPSDYPQYDLFWFGFKERRETFHILNNLPMGATIFDVGANFGYYSIFLASVLGPDAKAHAFEPNPPTLERLRKNVDLNQCSNVFIHPFGLSDVDGERAIANREGNSGRSQIVEGTGVEVRRLDTFVAEQGVDRLDFIKIDVEGHEERVLRGGAESIRRFRPMILIEFNPPDATRQRLADLLRDWGYQLYVPRRSGLERLEQFPGEQRSVNAVAIHSSAPPVKSSVSGATR